MGGAQTLEAGFKALYGAGQWRMRPLTVVMAMNNAAGSNIAVRHGLGGPFANFSTACSSSAMALGEAMLGDPLHGASGSGGAMFVALLLSTGARSWRVGLTSIAILTAAVVLAWLT